jgi:hypothetical protein
MPGDMRLPGLFLSAPARGNNENSNSVKLRVLYQRPLGVTHRRSLTVMAGLVSLCENSPSGILRGIFVSFAGRIARESEISAGGIQTGEIFSMRERRRRVFTQAACFGHPACGSIRPKSWMPACACMTGTVRPRADPGQQSASSASDRNGDLSRYILRYLSLLR